MSARLVAGNLDCETAYAGDPRGLPAAVAALASALATLMRAFARPGDRLRTPRPVEPGRIVAHDELGDVAFEAGPLAAAAPADEVLAWGETSETWALRRQAAPTAPDSRSLIEAVWAVAKPEPPVAARCNHRAMAFELAAELGGELPGARRVSSRAELEAHLAAGGARAGGGGGVVKAPYGAAGRERLLRRGLELSPDVRVRLDRLLARHGELIFEPWVERAADFGTCGLIDADDRITIFPPHRLRCDRQGIIRAVSVIDEGQDAVRGALRDELDGAARAAAQALVRAGYRGPFGVDAFTWRDEAGAPRLQPLCEINARLSLGFVARALGERFARAAGLRSSFVELRLSPAAAAGPEAIEVLRPGARDSAAACVVTPN